MRGKDLLGISIILSVMVFVLIAGAGLDTPTARLIIDAGVHDCGSDLDCFVNAMDDCAPTVIYNPDTSMDLMTIEPFNSTACLIHNDLKNDVLPKIISPSFDCKIGKSNYSWEALSETMLLALYTKECNGSAIEAWRIENGYRNLAAWIDSPQEAITVPNRGLVFINISLQYNVTYPSTAFSLHAKRQDGPWVKVRSDNISQRTNDGIRVIKGSWNTSTLNISNVTARIPTTFRVSVNFSNATHKITLYEDASFIIQATKEPVTVPVPTGDLYEPDGSFDTVGNAAKEIAVNGITQNRSFHIIGDTDYLFFEGEAKRVYTIVTHGLNRGTDTIIQAYDSNKMILDSDDDGGSEANASLLRLPLQKNERIYLRLSNAGSPGFYNITITRLVDNDGDGFTMGFDIQSDCDDNDIKKRPLAAGDIITDDVTLCPLACSPECTFYDIEQPITIRGTGIDIDCQYIPIKGTLSAPLFIVNESQGVNFKNCLAENFSVALIADDCNDCRVSNSTFTNNLIGIRVMGGKFTASQAYLTDNKFTGLYAIDAAKLTIDRTRIEKNLLEGLTIDDSAFITINQSIISQNGRHGIIMDGSVDAILQSNTISQNNNSGISMNSSRNIRIHSNRIEENRDGLVIFQSRENQIAGNNITRNKGSGISIQGGLANTSIKHNSIHANNGVDIKNFQPGGVNATHNYWSTRIEEDIRESIIDYYDSDENGIVYFSPWLISPFNYTEVLWAKNYTQCDDNLDNDGDGLIDFDGRGNLTHKDPDCPDAYWNNESYNPKRPNQNQTNNTNHSNDINTTNTTNTTVPIEVCVEDWECASWGECTGGKKTRSCLDRNRCGSVADKPPLETACEIAETALCNNQEKDTLEEGVDCGGPCPACKKPTDEEPKPPGEEEGGFPYITIAIAALCIAALGGGGFWYYKKYYSGHSSDMQDSSSHSSSKAEEYVRDSFMKGIPAAQIREMMFNSGWKHDDIDPALKNNDFLKGLHDYVKNAMDKGFKAEMIEPVLISSGWDQETVKKATRTVFDQIRLDDYLKNERVKNKVNSMAWGNHYQRMHSGMRDMFGKPMLEMAKGGFITGMQPQKQQPPFPPTPARETPRQASPPQAIENEEGGKKKYKLVEVDGKFIIEVS